MQKSTTPSTSSAGFAPDPSAPPVRDYWTVSRYQSLVRSHWDGMANGILVEAGSDKTVDELPIEVINQVRSKSMDKALKQGLRILRDAGKLLTEQQYADLSARRVLRPGDLVRYIGPSQQEEATLPNGDLSRIFRKHGQLGHIEMDRQNRRSPDGSSLLVFAPHIDETDGAPVKRIDTRLVVAPWRGRYWQLARIAD